MHLKSGKWRRIAGACLSVALAGFLAIPFVRMAAAQLGGKRTVRQACALFGPGAERRLVPLMKKAGVAYPPSRIVLLVFKEEQRIELWAASGGAAPRRVKDYPFTAFSGTFGPKLRQGDGQIPEGIYKIASRNPNSAYHMSMEVDYPNAFDQAKAREDKRGNLGNLIFIHGGAATIGCVPVGDEGIEELFVLVAKTGREKVSVVMAPCDLRVKPAKTGESPPAWIGELHALLRAELARYPVAASGE